MKHFKHTIIALIIIGVAAAGLLYAHSRMSVPPNHQALLQKAVDLKPTKRAPNFALPDLNGKLHALSQWQGHVRLLNFWATWCGPCRKEVPALVSLQQQFGSQGLQIIGIATDEPGVKVVKTFVKQFKINYPVLMDNGHATNIASHLGFSLIGLPASVLIDGDANIIGYHIGPINEKALAAKIKKLLKSREKAANDAKQA